jgi:hypothetical protein
MDELGRRHQTQVRVLPPEQDLGAHDTAGFQVYLGLIMEHELLPLEGIAHACLRIEALENLGVHLWCVKLVVVAP